MTSVVVYAPKLFTIAGFSSQKVSPCLSNTRKTCIQSANTILHQTGGSTNGVCQRNGHGLLYFCDFHHRPVRTTCCLDGRRCRSKPGILHPRSAVQSWCGPTQPDDWSGSGCFCLCIQLCIRGMFFDADLSYCSETKLNTYLP